LFGWIFAELGAFETEVSGERLTRLFARIG
jgi:hypothetical protein